VGLSTTASFSVLLAISSEALETAASIIIKRYAVRRRLFSDPKSVTLSDLEWLFRVTFFFRAGFSGFRPCEISKIIA